MSACFLVVDNASNSHFFLLSAVTFALRVSNVYGRRVDDLFKISTEHFAVTILLIIQTGEPRQKRKNVYFKVKGRGDKLWGVVGHGGRRSVYGLNTTQRHGLHVRCNFDGLVYFIVRGSGCSNHVGGDSQAEDDKIFELRTRSLHEVACLSVKFARIWVVYRRVIFFFVF